MDWLKCVGEVLNNQSFAAFIGAFAAFILVVMTDRRRERKKVRNIRGEIELNLALAHAKLETVRRNRNAMREANKVIPAPILKFNTVLIRQLSAEVLDRLSVDQRRAIEALCYTMKATDGILDDAYRLARQLGKPLGHAERITTAEQLLVEFGDSIASLKRLVGMCGNYVAGRYAVITSKQYDQLEYEEP